jgi:hypothetical protein
MSKSKLYYYKRLWFKDDVYLLNTCPLSLVLLDFASLLHHQDIDVESLTLQELADAMGLDNIEPYVTAFPVFQKKWKSRKDSFLDDNRTSETRSEVGKVGAQARWAGHWIKQIEEVAEPFLSIWNSSRGVKEEDAELVTAYMTTHSNPHKIIEKFRVYLLWNKENGKNAKAFYRWLTENELKGKCESLPLKDKEKVSTLKVKNSLDDGPLDEGPKSKYEIEDDDDERFN